MLDKPRKFLIRWVFDYSDKPTRRGIWSTTTKNPVDQAWNKTTGASRMRIETKDMYTKEVKTVVDCPAKDFRSFRWMAIARVPSFAGNVQPIHQLVGLEMWTDEKRIQVFDTGDIKLSELSEENKNLQLVSYGK